MADDLLIQILDLQPVSRRIAAEQPGYPWGDGLENENRFITDTGPRPPLPVSPDRRPSRWPNALDLRSNGFLPWSQSTATPSPAAYSGVFQIVDAASPWPSPADDGATVYLYPRCDPSLPTTECVWDVSGLAGGAIWVRTYLEPTFVDNPVLYPGHLAFCSYANFTGPNDPATYQSDLQSFNTTGSYEGPFKYWGPLFVNDLHEVDPLECDNVFGDVAGLLFDISGFSGCCGDGLNGPVLAPTDQIVRLSNGNCRVNGFHIYPAGLCGQTNAPQPKGLWQIQQLANGKFRPIVEWGGVSFTNQGNYPPFYSLTILGVPNNEIDEIPYGETLELTYRLGGQTICSPDIPETVDCVFQEL